MRRTFEMVPSMVVILQIFMTMVYGNIANETCGSDELNHSILVQCDKCSVEDKDDAALWPVNSGDIISIQSTRDGKRFLQSQLRNLDSKVNTFTMQFDINTTLSVYTKSFIGTDIRGIGGTLIAAKLAEAIEDNSFERLYGLILSDLLGSSGTGTHMAYLRLQLDTNFIREHNLTNLLLELDAQMLQIRGKNVGSPELNIIIHTKGRLNVMELEETLIQVHTHLKNIKIWGLALEHDELKELVELSHFRSLLPRDIRLLASVPMTEAPSLLEWDEAKGKILRGLLLNSEASAPYDVLDYLVAETSSKGYFRILTLGRPRPQTRLLGDWFNAHEYAIEILNHLKHGANGFIQDQTVCELQADSSTSDADCSIYSLTKNHGTHFKGPMFYATGHFSRYLTASRPLYYDLHTQPNMFSSHYSAFMTIDKKYIVSVVLNGNEHMLPFSWNIDNTIVANTLLDPKSFNTFILKV